MMRRALIPLLAATSLFVILAAESRAAGDELQLWRRRRPIVQRVDVEGNHALSDAAIRARMTIRPPGLWARLGLRRKPLLLVGAETRDEGSIRQAYQQRGYWDARAKITATRLPDGQDALVTVTVEEGRRYHWGDVTLGGEDERLVREGKGALGRLKRGQPADSLALGTAVAAIRAICANSGHPQAIVNLAVTPRADTLDVAMTLHPGAPVVLGTLAITGNVTTRASLIRREIHWPQGAPYSQKRLAWRQEDLYATGLFTFVHLEPVGVDSADTGGVRVADFHLRVVERKPSFIGFRTGAGQDPDFDLTWDYAFEWGSRNWRGTGRQWSLSAQSGFAVVTDWRALHHEFAASYTEPWPFGVRLPTTLTLSYEPAVRSAKQDYRVERSGAELSATRRIGRVTRWTSSLVYERVRIFDVPEERRLALLESGVSFRRRWDFSLQRDTRPNVFVPTAGALTRVTTEYVGGILGGSIDFYTVDVTWARYQVVSAPTVFASRLRLAWANTHSGGTSIPTLDRFYLGGANSIRGYPENKIGPVDSLGNPVGGRVVALANVELRAPAWPKLWFSLFLDAGNNFESFKQAAFDDILVSLGIGWQYIAPVGPIRLDYARRVVHPHYAKSDRLHLSILFAF